MYNVLLKCYNYLTKSHPTEEAFMEFRINELKHKLQLTSKQIADDLKVSPHTENSWLSGKRTPRPSQIMNIEHVYDLNPGWLTGKTDIIYPSPAANRRRKQVKDIMTCQSDFAERPGIDVNPAVAL